VSLNRLHESESLLLVGLSLESARDLLSDDEHELIQIAGEVRSSSGWERDRDGLVRIVKIREVAPIPGRGPLIHHLLDLVVDSA
jgi:hypothetical protein